MSRFGQGRWFGADGVGVTRHRSVVPSQLVGRRAWPGVACGGLVIALGGLVVAGWLVGSERLVSVVPGFIAMRFNTALCFVVAGVGLVAVVRGWFRVGLAASALLVGFAGVILLEFVTGSDWGSDVWLQPDLLGAVPMPGRMHETTAAGFVMVGSGLGLVSWPGLAVWRMTSATVLAGLAGGFGLIGLFGYVAHLSTVSRTAELVGFGMALHTAIGFVVLSLGALGIFGSLGRSGEGQVLGRWRAPVAGLVVLALGLVLWQALEAEEQDRIREATRAVAEKTVVEAGFRAELMLVAVEALAEATTSPDGVFEDAAGFWVSRTPGLVAVALVDERSRVSDVVVASGRDLADYAELIRSTPLPAGPTTAAVWLPNDTRGLVLYRRVADPGVGWVAAVVGSRSLLSAVFDGLHSGFAAEVVEDGQPIFSSSDRSPVEGVLPVELPLRLAGVDWTLRAWPDTQQLTVLASPLPELALVGAVTVALLFATAIHFATRADIRRREAETIGAALAAEVEVRRRAQGELEVVAERLRRSNRELQEFAFVASHDLQEPLRKIRAFGDRLASRLGDGLDDKSADYLERMVGAAKRMQILINDLLAFSRLTSRAQPFQPVDLNRVVREVLDDLEVVLADSTGKVEVGELPEIDAEPVQMRQLFQNLIGNAVKYRDPNRAPIVTVSAEMAQLNGSVKIRVADNGIGFEPDQSERIFQLFQRLHGRGEYEGTGMGLAISRRIAERHGGSLVADGQPEKGSTFLLTLPIHQPTREDRT